MTDIQGSLGVEITGTAVKEGDTQHEAVESSRQPLPPAIAWLLRMLGANPKFLYMRHRNPWLVIVAMTSACWGMLPASLVVTSPVAYGYYWHPVFLPLHRTLPHSFTAIPHIKSCLADPDFHVT